MSELSTPVNYSLRGHSLEAAQAKEPTRESARMRILQGLRAGPMVTTEIIYAGGTEGLRRLRELRQMGYGIRAERVMNSTQWRYSLLSEPGNPGNARDTGPVGYSFSRRNDRDEASEREGNGDG